MILADSHLHLFSRGYPGAYGKSLFKTEIDVYEALRAAHGIAAGCVIGYEAGGIDPANNAYIRLLAADHDWMATFAYIDVRSAPSRATIAGLLDSGHVGIALYLERTADAEAGRAWPAATWQGLAQRRALVSLNAPPDSLAAFATIIEANAGCTFLVSHMGLPGGHASPPSMEQAAERLAPLLRLARLPNVVVKLSAAYAISAPSFAFPHDAAAPFARTILRHFGAERCLWGSDFSPALDHVSFAQTVAIPWLGSVDDRERRQVMGGNLMTLLGKTG